MIKASITIEGSTDRATLDLLKRCMSEGVAVQLTTRDHANGPPQQLTPYRVMITNIFTSSDSETA